MKRAKNKPKLSEADAGLETEIRVDRYRRGAFLARVAELEPKFPGLKAVLTHDPMEGKTALDFAPDPPPSTVIYSVTAPYPEYKVGPFTLKAVLTMDAAEKKSLWVAEEGVVTRELIEEADFLRCDHCSTRRRRKKLFFFTHEEKEGFTQVGSTCCKDYVGVDVERELRKFARGLEIGFADDDGWDAPRGGPGAVNGLDAEFIVPFAILVVEKHGYVSKRIAKEQDKASTADWIEWLMARPTRDDPEEIVEERARIAVAIPKRKEELIAALGEYAVEARARLEKKWSEFLFNLCENFEYTTTGFAAFIASDIIKKRVKSNGNGKPKSKCLDLPLSTKMADLGTFELTFKREEDSMYGVAYFHVAKATDGTTVMFRRSVPDLEVGELFALRGKVKKHLKDATVIGYPKPKPVKEKAN